MNVPSTNQQLGILGHFIRWSFFSGFGKEL
jgi:hypothetical protein